jgi:hypothetical protein
MLSPLYIKVKLRTFKLKKNLWKLNKFIKDIRYFKNAK